MFLGTYEHRIDVKGRLVLPAKLRQELDQVVFATIGIDRCVSLYSSSQWENVLKKLETLPFAKGTSRGLLRIMLSSAHEIPIDGAGRILLPNMLRNHAKLEQDVFLVGVSDHIEIWDKATWEEYRENILQSLPSMTESVDGF